MSFYSTLHTRIRKSIRTHTTKLSAEECGDRQKGVFYLPDKFDEKMQKKMPHTKKDVTFVVAKTLHLLPRLMKRPFLVFAFALVLASCSQQQGAGFHYRRGARYEQQGRHADAMRAYRMAASGNNDSGYVEKANAAIGHLYLAAGNRAEALAHYRKSYALAADSRDTAMLVLALRDMSRCYRGGAAGMPDSALACFEEAEHLIRRAHLDTLRPQLWPEWLAVTMEAGDLDAVGRMLDQQPIVPDLTTDQGPLWLAMGRAQLMAGRRQQAVASLQQAAGSTNVKTHAAATMLLSQVEADDGNHEDAWLSAMECVAMLDSINRQTVAANRNHVEALAQQLEVERENASLRLRLVLTAVAMLLAIAALAAFFRSKTRRLRQTAERYRQAQQAMHRNSEAYMAEAEHNIARLNAEIDNARQHNDQLEAQLLALSRQREEQRLTEARERRTQQEQLMAAFRQTPLHTAFDGVGQTGSGTIGEEQWKQLEDFANQHAEQFVGRLMEYYPPMRTNDLRLCLLVKMGFSNLQISNIFHRTQQATTNARKRLFTRMFNREGQSDDLNRFILSF